MGGSFGVRLLIKKERPPEKLVAAKSDLIILFCVPRVSEETLGTE